MSDGSVEALAQGKKEDLEVFVEWCHSGPPGASVTKVNAEYSDIQDFTYTSFLKRSGTFSD
eukprot:CAMPEP_0182450620 /NCGR_PEP_ID=MMETSP1172-20130603/42569_1 /TAXON_ID=708627 /ORGANISM="Timspurckia oligopyrenoides, Strain CCMP3278" /LENGTH=60 /DNA_ID=CAMNT_0024648299 /DNA_START=189 /DNA_END=371 /DNA_ORIENTATION=-